MISVKIEVCVDDHQGLDAAIDGGADRIELCSRLDLGGLTPEAGLLDRVFACPVPVRAMIRLRGGGFVLSADDIDQMVAQIEVAHNAGCEGVVFGAATADGELDIAALRQLTLAANGLGKTLHRVVDTLADPVEAVRIAQGLGIDTILSSGGQPSAEDGIPLLCDMIQQASSVTIMPGAGVTVANAARIASATSARWIHGSFKGSEGITSGKAIESVRRALEDLQTAP